MRTPDWVPAAVLVVCVLLLTINFWYRFYRSHEGFENSQLANLADQVLGSASVIAPEIPPSDSEMAKNYYNFLLYIKTDYPKGLKFVYDLNTRIYGSATKMPDNFDPRTVLNNYVNPLTGI
uniref:Uncharacterized protein n=1 Tax=viral metagenome TaxID=1070528 RepID=A0A6C0DT62_9ZZZZ